MLTIHPAGFDGAADADDSVDTLTVTIDRARLALAAAEGSERQAQLIERVSSYDRSLLALARTLAFESTDDYPNGPLFGNEVASRFIDRLAARHMSALLVRCAACWEMTRSGASETMSSRTSTSPPRLPPSPE